MTLNTQTPRVVITGNGTRGPYNFTDSSSQAIRAISTSHIQLTRYAASTTANSAGTLLVENTDYTIGGSQDARTFTLTSVQAVLTSSQRIVAERVQGYNQDLDLTTGGAFTAASIESRFDKVAEFQQELKARLDRVPALQFADATANVAFPSPPTDAAKAMGRNTAGEIVYLTPASFDSDVLLGSGWEPYLESALAAVYVQSYKTASNTWKEAADLAVAAAQAAGLPNVHFPAAFTLTATITRPSGIFFIAAPGGSTVTIPTTGVPAFSSEGTTTALTLASNITLPADRATFTSPSTSIAAGSLVAIFNTATGHHQILKVRGKTSDNNTLIFTSNIKFATTTAEASIVWISGPVTGGGFSGDWTFSGAGAASADANAYYASYCENMTIEGVWRGANITGTVPQVSGSDTGLIYGYVLYNCDFTKFNDYRSGGANRGAMLFQRVSNCRWGELVSDRGSSFGISWTNATDCYIAAIHCLGAQARGVKFELPLDTHVGYANVQANGATGFINIGVSGYSGGGRLYVDTMVLSRMRPAPTITSLSRSAGNVATCVTSDPHGYDVGSITATVSGHSTASLNTNYTVATVPDAYTFTATLDGSAAALTGGAASHAGSPIFVVTSEETNSTFASFNGSAGNYTYVSNMRIIGSNLTNRDISLGTADRLYIGNLDHDSTLSLGATTTINTNLFIGRRNGISKFTFSANKNGTNQTGITAASYTKVTFGTEAWDVGGYYDTSTSKFTPPAGKYLIILSLTVSGVTASAGDPIIPAIYKNGSLLHNLHTSVTTGGGGRANASCIIDADGDDEYEFYLYAGSSSTYSIEGATTQSFVQGVAL